MWLEMDCINKFFQSSNQQNMKQHKKIKQPQVKLRITNQTYIVYTTTV